MYKSHSVLAIRAANSVVKTHSAFILYGPKSEEYMKARDKAQGLALNYFLGTGFPWLLQIWTNKKMVRRLRVVKATRF